MVPCMFKFRSLTFWQSALAIIGLIDAIYLIIIKFSNNKALCIPGLGDCWSVNTSRYSEIFGIPVSVLGAGAFILILVLQYLESKTELGRNYSVYAIFGVSLVGVLYSAYLTYLEIAVIHAICPFCVLSAIVMLAIFAIAVTRLLKFTAMQTEP